MIYSDKAGERMQEEQLIQIFGLSLEETRILFSMEYLLVLKDIQETKQQEKRELKKQWLAYWRLMVEKMVSKERKYPLYTRFELAKAVRENAEKKEQNTWYQLILLESVAFVPYTALALEGKENLNQSFRKLRYRKQNDFLKKLVIEHAISSETMVDRYAKSYEKSLNTGLGRKQKMINRGLFVLASAAVVAAGVGVAAPSIAVALKGAGFAGLQGASLVSASLAALGGGAIAIGGKGMVGGLATLVGGGALLGGLTGGAVVSATHLLSKTSPEVIISQGAKLSVVMKEIILNQQQDTLNAQAVLKGMKEEILAMNQELKKLQLDRIEDKKQIKNLEEAIKGLEKLYEENKIFESSFEIGMNVHA